MLSLAEALQHPHNQARNAFVELAGITQPAPAPGLSVTTGSVHNPLQLTAIDIEAALRKWA